MSLSIGDKKSAIFSGLSGFWQRFFRDTQDLEAFYQASEEYLGQVYLDLMGAVLNTGIVDTPIFNKEYWKLFLIDETEVNFLEGASTAEDRYWYDMPGAIASVDFLQNTIFNPDVLFERDVDFDVINNDGLIRFTSDPFMGSFDTGSGDWTPQQGIAWRTITKQVGNQFTDFERTTSWVDDTNVKRGDTLRLLAYANNQVQTGTTGTITHGSPTVFSDPGFNELLVKEGDILVVSGTIGTDVEFNGIYVMGRLTAPGQVDLENTFHLPAGSSTTPLVWRHYRAVYYTSYKDYEVDYFNKTTIIGPATAPYPVDIKTPIVYSIVREPANSQVYGVSIAATGESYLGYRHLEPGSVVVHARVIDSLVPFVAHAALEGTDYTIDYFHGRLNVLVAFDASSPLTCDFKYKKEVLYSGGGRTSLLESGRVKQLSLWVPEAQVDRFNLYYNYGSLLNRFEVSSETYKAFLRGILYLYVSGPILERLEAALNVAAGFPLVKADGEILQNYDSGEIGSGSDGAIDSVTFYFSSASHTFKATDVGGWIVLSDPVNDFNKGSFRVAAFVDSHTVQLSSSYGFVTETGMDWVLTHTYQKTVTTDKRIYRYPYNIPMRTDVMDPYNYGTLTFDAFEALTTGFTVTDYVETPYWWVEKYIPSILWNEGLERRFATAKLFEHVIGPEDDLRIGDPGFYIGADDEGHVFAPTDGLGSPVSLYRHCTAFILFDRYLKCHMFQVSISSDLELDAAFVADLEELILVAKPSYTYPYVEPVASFEDIVKLSDTFVIPTVNMGMRDDLVLSDNYLYIGDSDFPWSIGDYYRYWDLTTTVTGVTGVVSPTTYPAGFALPIASVNCRLLSVILAATVSGNAVVEGRDYKIQWNTDAADAWYIIPMTTWDSLTTALGVTMEFANVDNLAVTPVPDTTIGYTPLGIGGLNPYFVRKEALDPHSPTYLSDVGTITTRHTDRALSLWITDSGGSYTYT